MVNYVGSPETTYKEKDPTQAEINRTENPHFVEESKYHAAHDRHLTLI
jgi:hypothetical protein